MEERAGIRPDVGIADDETVFRKASVFQRVRNDHRLRAENGMAAKRNIPRGLLNIQTPDALEPLAVFVDEADQDDRHRRRQRGFLDDRVEKLLRISIENFTGSQELKALQFRAW